MFASVFLLTLVNDLPKPFSKHTMLANANGIVFVIGGDEILQMDCSVSCINQNWTSVWRETEKEKEKVIEAMTAVFYPEAQSSKSKFITNLM